ncbi:hypothetical protein [Methanosphaerula palustris]|uniref:hypothetical protein n=1 Tax=Methanosphaerula palustris TaxID=475088 RepID=UPI0003215A03|nr:hypothetical protein [Methanosphaerula palustris]
MRESPAFEGLSVCRLTDEIDRLIQHLSRPTVEVVLVRMGGEDQIDIQQRLQRECKDR